MKRIIVFNKMDLDNEKKTLSIIKKIEEESKMPCMHISTKENININKLLSHIQ